MDKRKRAPTVQSQMEETWLHTLKQEFGQPYFSELQAFLKTERKSAKVYPPAAVLFRAFELTPFPNVKVVILGQDPYHGQGQAHGLSFSVERGLPVPPSLKNIFKELHSDMGVLLPTQGDLSGWAHQGVFLLNATLSVRHKSPGSHQKKGWETFTDAAIKSLSDQKEHLVFMLWGNFARAKKALIDREKHLVLEAPHPSPFSAYTGFFGSRHFSKANAYLQTHHIDPVDWSALPK
ncbi:MAG: uracil-DNA glycosylase [Flavobacteriales bacterium]|nr:uracil-DNA glycosylase [Flavobacteriales bacterium]